VWVAPTDHRSAPHSITSAGNEDSPHFLPDGDLLLRVSEGSTNYLYRLRADGTNRRKTGPAHILDFSGVSPDGRWAIASSEVPNEHLNVILYAYAVDGDAQVPLCTTLCDVIWNVHGDYAQVSVLGQDSGTVVLPARRESGLPDLTAGGIGGITDLKGAKGAKVLTQGMDTFVNTGLFAYTRTSIRRNLYRIPVP
jgi:eukaryotic-like serine/threonine-protein kinase